MLAFRLQPVDCMRTDTGKRFCQQRFRAIVLHSSTAEKASGKTKQRKTARNPRNNPVQRQNYRVVYDACARRVYYNGVVKISA